MIKTLDKKKLAIFVIGIALIIAAVMAWGTQNQKAQAATTYTLTLTAGPSEYGVVIGGGTNENSTRTITATANLGYKFYGWTFTSNPIYGNISSKVTSTATFTFGQGNTALMANFVPISAVFPSGVISSTNVQYDKKDVVINGSTVQIDGEHYFNSLTIINDGVLTQKTRSPGDVGSMQLIINKELIINSGGKITADGFGYSGGTGKQYGYGPGGGGWSFTNSIYVYAGSGGGYGGLGADVGSYTYGDKNNPDQWGSGGGGGMGVGSYGYNGDYTGGSGGGLIVISANKIIIDKDGSISANGKIGEIGNGGRIGGGGSGGSICIVTNSFNHEGMISANGGDGVAGSYFPPYAGGGGRIKILSKKEDGTWSGEQVFEAGRDVRFKTVTANGGIGGSGIGTGGAREVAGDGTVVISRTDGCGGLSFPNKSPLVRFVASPISGSVPLSVQFTDTSTDPDGDGITGWFWDFNNDGIIDSVEKKPLHKYSSVGTYTASLMVQDSRGAFSDTATKTITVDKVLPGTININSTLPDTTITVKGPSPATTTYTGTVVTPNVAVAVSTTAPIGSYTATCPAKTGYTFIPPSIRTLTAGGTIGFVCSYTSVNSPPVAKFDGTQLGTTMDFKYYDQSTDPDGDTITSWAWKVTKSWDPAYIYTYTSSDSQKISDDPSPFLLFTKKDLAYTYPEYTNGGGLYSFTLTVTDSRGAMGTVTKTAGLNPPAPSSASLSIKPDVGRAGANIITDGAIVNAGASVTPTQETTGDWTISGSLRVGDTVTVKPEMVAVGGTVTSGYNWQVKENGTVILPTSLPNCSSVTTNCSFSILKSNSTYAVNLVATATSGATAVIITDNTKAVTITVPKHILNPVK